MASKDTTKEKFRFPFLQIRGLQTAEHFDYFTLTLGASMARSSSDSHLKTLQKMFPSWHKVEPGKKLLSSRSQSALGDPSMCVSELSTTRSGTVPIGPVELSNSPRPLSNQATWSFTEEPQTPSTILAKGDPSKKRSFSGAEDMDRASFPHSTFHNKPRVPSASKTIKPSFRKSISQPNVTEFRKNNSEKSFKQFKAQNRKQNQPMSAQNTELSYKSLSRQRENEGQIKDVVLWKMSKYMKENLPASREGQRQRKNAVTNKEIDMKNFETENEGVFHEIASLRRRSTQSSWDMIHSRSPRERRSSSSSCPRRSSAIERILADVTETPQSTSYQRFFHRRRRSQLRSVDLPALTDDGLSFSLPGKSLERFRRLVKAIRVITAVCWALKSYVREKVTTHWSFVELYLHLQKDITPVLAFNPQQFCKIEPPKGGRKLECLLSIPTEQRTPTDIQKILAFIRTHETFQRFPPNVQVKMCRVMQYQSYDPQTIIIKKGHTASAFYLVLSGSLIVNVPQINPLTGTTFVETVAYVRRGQSFGEIALLEGIPRSATLVCLSRAELLVIYKEDFDYLILEPLLKQRDDDIDFCLSHSLFEEFPREVFEANPDHFFYQYFPADSVIASDSSSCPFLILVKAGECQIVGSFEKEDCEQYKPLIGHEMENIFPMHDLMRKVSSGKMQDLTSQFDSMIASVLTQRRKVGLFLKPHCLKESRSGSQTESQRARGLTTNGDLDEQDEDENQGGELQEDGGENISLRDEKTFVQVAILRRGSVFGLETLTTTNRSPLSVVSQGVECIMVSKQFFLQHANIKSLRVAGDMVTQYPSSAVLSKRLKACHRWKAYKKDLVHNAPS